ncbi:T-cell surface glycoprotein CD8 alpha chain isoform X2 [Heteronotia binoei]|uniref:T-cell surface glycoprotein CD8 alpha chain isoform X2 n=1 Tax=Heteronotia binoei TaxID=13085 RepID=UPI00292F08A7|nr:T-cell surface glycoprotein CD8 alpha chain isoform X2 [Heteronotia binoei]
MVRVSSILRLSLILCYCSSQIITMKIKMISKPPEAINARVELDCEAKYSDAGVYWILQKNDHSPKSILYVSSRSKPVPDNQDYEISKSGSSYKLTVKAFKAKDEGIYSCSVLHNQALHLSKRLPVFLPVTTTPAPTTQQHAPKPLNPNDRHITSEPNKCSENTVTDPYDGLMLPCDPYIWIPLSSGCFLLFITLVITFTVCCDPRRRRRRCQCKRPLNGTNGKPTMPR